jgi:hypothetical protein
MAGLNKSQDASLPPKPKVLKSRQLKSQQSTPRTCLSNLSPNSSAVRGLNPLHTSLLDFDLDSLYEQTSEDCLKIEKVCLMQKDIERRERKLKEREGEFKAQTGPNDHEIRELVSLVGRVMPEAEVSQENIKDWRGLFQVLRLAFERAGSQRDFERKNSGVVKGLKEELEMTQLELRRKQQELRYAEQRLEDKEKEVGRLEEARDSLEDKCQQLTQTSDKLETKAHGELARRQRIIEQLEADCKAQEAKQTRQRRALEEQLSSLERSQAYLDSKERELGQRELTQESKEVELRHLQSQFLDKQKEFEQFILQKEESFDMTERKLHDSQLQLNLKDSEINDFLAKIERHRQEVEYNSEIKKQRLDEQEQELAEQTQQLSLLRAEIDRGRELLKANQHDFEASKQLYQRQITERERSLSTIERTLAGRRDEVDCSFSELKREMMSLEELKQEVEQEKMEYFARVSSQTEDSYRLRLKEVEEQRERDHLTVQEYRAQMEKTQAEFEHFKLLDKLQKIQIKQLKGELEAKDQRTPKVVEPRLKELQEKEAELHNWHSELLRKERMLLESEDYSFDRQRQDRRLNSEYSDYESRERQMADEREELERATYMIEQLHLELEQSKAELDIERTALDQERRELNADKANFEQIIAALEAESKQL